MIFLSFVNRNNQRILMRTTMPGTDHNQYIYIIQCLICELRYGGNGSNNYHKKCPRCWKAAPCILGVGRHLLNSDEI